MYNKIDKELSDTIKSAYPENSEEIKNEIINRNLTFKITLNERNARSSLQNDLLKYQILLK